LVKTNGFYLGAPVVPPVLPPALGAPPLELVLAAGAPVLPPVLPVLPPALGAPPLELELPPAAGAPVLPPPVDWLMAVKLVVKNAAANKALISFIFNP
jgi:hypothetical protein